MAKSIKEIKVQLLLAVKVLRLAIESSPPFASFYLFFSLLNSITPSLSFFIGKLTIDAVVAAIQTPLPEKVQLVIILAFINLLVEVINSAFANLSTYGYDRIKDIFTKFTTNKVLEKSAELDLSYFENPKFHDQLDKVQREIGYRPTEALWSSVDLVSSVFGIFSLLFILLRLSIWVPIILLLFSLPRLLFRLKFSYWTYGITDSRSPYNRKISQLTWLLTYQEAAKEIKVFSLKDYLISRFNRFNDRFIAENRQLSRKQNLYSFVLDILGTGSYYAFMVFAAFKAVFGKITIGDLTMYSGTIRQFQNILQGIFADIARFYESNMFLTRYFEFIELKPTIVNSSIPKIIDNSRPVTIEFKNVNFTYNRDKPLVLKNINFQIREAQNLALVGENGAGKTTLIKLLLRLYDVTSGQILINGMDIREIDIASLRANVGVIFQDFMTYEMTVMENIGFGDIKRIEETDKIKKAAELSGAAEFIEKFPEEYNTMLGKYFEKGEELSGGQWQKIALARAFFKDARVLALDEPTASLDPKAEYLVFANLIKQTKNKSLILVSHRFSTVRLADNIIVLHKGEIIEEGSHEQLMVKNGHYAKLFSLQAKWYR
jgi:ATP-binding cassette subfamily B protein